MEDLTEEQRKKVIKEAVKEAIKEWLEKEFALFGKWSFFGILAMFFSLMVYAWFYFGLWKH